ncbi:MAG: ABC transporter permease [Chloroflexota bacterium]|nr:ABC transporter permease [Chloroflexota bacterium]
MTQLLGIPLDTLAIILLVITAVIIVGVILLALANAIFFKIGVRNIPRRRAQMLLIVFALMLSTTLLSSVMATGDVITGAVQSVATYNLGNVDETIEGGQGDLGFYDDSVYYALRDRVKNDPNIAALGAGIIERSLLVADQTSRQVRSNVNALAALPGSEQGFGGLQNEIGRGNLRIADLKPNEVYVNHTAALLLNAHAGDTLYLYSKRWPGRRYPMHVRAIAASGGMIGEVPYVVSQLQTFRTIERRHDDITHIFVANRNTGGSATAVANSVEEALEHGLPRYVHVIQVKQQGVQNSQKAEDIFARIFALFCLFVLAIGLLLIFLIFVLLAAERRVEMGMARAIGVLRRHLILMFLFEGVVYDLLASFIGLLIGVGAGALLVVLLGPVLQRFDFPLKLTFQPHSLVIAYCLGVIFTFCSVAISSWLVSRMTVVEAIRNLPERTRQTLSLAEIAALMRRALAPAPGSARSYKHIPDLLIELARALVMLGILPILCGAGLLLFGLDQKEVAPFSFGLSLIVIGCCLLIRALAEWAARVTKAARVARVGRIMAHVIPAVAGLAMCAYWALPFDAFANLGLPRFQAGIEIFFLAGMMMILGTAWALIANAEVLINPLLWLSRWRPGWHVMSRLASAYPLHYRFRMGLSVVMFSMVVFAMTVMAVITSAMQSSYADINVQTGGYDIQAVAYFRPLPLGLAHGSGPRAQQSAPDQDVRTLLTNRGINPDDFSAIGVRTTTAVGVIQPDGQTPAWHLYPAQVVSGGFLQGYGLHLSARARGFDSDSAVWRALQAHPNYALIDSSALPFRPDSSPVYDPNAASAKDAGFPATPPGFNSYYTFSMDGVYQGDTTFAPTTLWAAKGAIGGVTSATKLTVIGVVDNSDSAHFGLYISHAAYGQITVDPSTPELQTYYFKVAPGQDKRALSLALGSAFLDNGLETTVLEDAVWQVRGPRILLSNILLGLVGMALLLGVAALAITGTRAVIERRQQIGMLRALGCQRYMVQGAFLCESFLVGLLGSLLGVVLGLILASNIFAVNFFERYQTGLVFTIPWVELGLVVGVALLASLLAALLPAWQAGRITPMEALRYS